MVKSLAIGLLTAWVCVLAGCNKQAAQVDQLADNDLQPGEQADASESSPNDSHSTQSDPLNRQGRNESLVLSNASTGEAGNRADETGFALGNSVGPVIQDQTSVLNSTFMTLQPTQSSDPNELLEHLRNVDVAIGDLIRAGTSNIIEKVPYEQNGVRLAKMKLSTGERLANSTSASDEQRKSGVLSQLEALSHLSSLGDVVAAKQLAGLAESLATTRDPDLSQRARIVLIGFELQDLENGVSTDPSGLLAQAAGLCRRLEDLNFPSFMMLIKANSTLRQLGFQEAAGSIMDVITGEFLKSPDPQLRGEAWTYAARDTQALAAYVQAKRSLGNEDLDSPSILGAARILYETLPYPTTLEWLASEVADYEYGGKIAISRQLADFVKQAIQKLPEESNLGITNRLLVQHESRVGLLGRPLELTGVVDFDGNPIDWKDYEGKTVLIDFWATWCLPCLEEIPNLRAAYSTYSNQGFEVIGVNMDENLEEARENINRQNFPWRNFYFEGQPGFESDFALRVGLTMIPFVVIVGPDGNVAHLHVRGDKLGTILSSMLTADE